jgi:hypothetical protein
LKSGEESTDDSGESDDDADQSFLRITPNGSWANWESQALSFRFPVSNLDDFPGLETRENQPSGGLHDD